MPRHDDTSQVEELAGRAPLAVLQGNEGYAVFFVSNGELVGGYVPKDGTDYKFASLSDAQMQRLFPRLYEGDE